MLKAWLRSAAGQGLLARLVAAYVELVIATLRWRYENVAEARLALERPEGLIALFWHGRIVPGIACRPLLGAKPRAVMISLSRDGGFIAKAAERLGIPTIRGSAGRPGEAGVGALGGGKGGAAAFRQALDVLAGGGVMILTPDGPRGPARVMQAGPVLLARTSRRPAYLMGLAVRPALKFGSWDGGVLPLPFGRAALVVDGPLAVAADAGSPAVEAARADWQARLNAAQDRAQALLNGRR
jgi:lysophospholipid acyltransferase (LPLAT)-like uncharacterized protein